MANRCATSPEPDTLCGSSVSSWSESPASDKNKLLTTEVVLLRGASVIVSAALTLPRALERYLCASVDRAVTGVSVGCIGCGRPGVGENTELRRFLSSTPGVLETGRDMGT